MTVVSNDLCEMVGVVPICFHDHRNTMATRLANRFSDLNSVSMILRHSQLAVASVLCPCQRQPYVLGARVAA